MFSGTLERSANIRWIFSHAGGFAPYIRWRLALADGIPALREKAPKGVLRYLRTLYFDTALSPSPSALAALLELADPSHILRGSEFPFAPEPAVGLEVATLAGSERLTPDLRAGVERGHAPRLLPGLSASAT